MFYAKVRVRNRVIEVAENGEYRNKPAIPYFLHCSYEYNLYYRVPLEFFSTLTRKSTVPSMPYSIVSISSLSLQ